MATAPPAGVAAAPARGRVHGGGALDRAPDRPAVRATGIALIVLMGVLGLIMRLTQATVVDLSPGWFYRLLTLHGMGMITGALIAAMSALWYVFHDSVPLRVGHMLASYALIVAGALRAGRDASRWLRRSLDVPAAAAVLPGRPVVDLVGDRVLRRRAARRQRLLRLLHRRAQADDEHLRRPHGALGWRFLRGRRPSRRRRP